MLYTVRLYTSVILCVCVCVHVGNEAEVAEGSCYWRGAFLDLEIQAVTVTSDVCRRMCREETGSDGSCFFSDCLCDFNGAPYLPVNADGRVF